MPFSSIFQRESPFPTTFLQPWVLNDAESMGNIQMDIQPPYVKIKPFCVKYELEKQHFTALVSAFNPSGRIRKGSLSSPADDPKGLGKRAK